MCCIEENKKRDFERLYEQEQWEKLKNAADRKCRGSFVFKHLVNYVR